MKLIHALSLTLLVIVTRSLMPQHFKTLIIGPLTSLETNIHFVAFLKLEKNGLGDVALLERPNIYDLQMCKDTEGLMFTLK